MDQQNPAIESMNDFLAVAAKIPESTVYSMFFVYSDDKDENGDPKLRALFSYARSGAHIVFNAVGLTDSSRGIPYQHYGLIGLSAPVAAWRFEDRDDAFSSEGAVARCHGAGMHDFDEPEDCDDSDIPCSPALMRALEVVEEVSDGFYTAADSDEGEYRLDRSKRPIMEDDCWVQDGFVQAVYQVADKVLITASGWSWT
jgi:hypothetical protein